MKSKKRYLSYEITPAIAINKSDFEKAFMQKGLELYGTMGYSEMEAMMVKQISNKGFMKVKNNYVDRAKAIFAAMEKINDKSITVKSIHASGTINKLMIKTKNLSG